MSKTRSENGEDDNDSDYGVTREIHSNQYIKIKSLYTEQHLACAVQSFKVIPQ
jgi:hypothetical protein